MGSWGLRTGLVLGVVLAFGVSSAAAAVPPPPPTIDSGPIGFVSSTSATFTFSDTQAGVTFECSLNAEPFAACTSPMEYTGLPLGSHTFQVRATDGVDPSTSAARTWTVDTVAPPVPTITSGPSRPVASRSASFSFTDDEGGTTFECRLDGGLFAPCVSPRVLTGLAQGPHTFRVRALDAAGNASAAASRAWKVDTIAPRTTIVTGPKLRTASHTARFTFRSSEAGSKFQCKLDRRAWQACKSPRTYRNLGRGDHVLRVRAKDAAGNVDRTPAKRSWRVV